MKTADQVRFLVVALAVVAAAFAQSSPPATPVGPAQSAAQAAAQTGIPATQPVVTVVAPAVPAVPAVLPAKVLPPSGATEPPLAGGETAVTLDVGNGIRAVPPSRLTVPAGETLLITGPSFGGRPVQWFKDGRALPGAVGPTLASFGVANPLRAPVLRLFDSSGKPYTNGYVYPAVVGGPTYETDLADSLAKTGAFPIPTGTLDAVVMMPFLPGAYTAQVTSGDATAGTVLLEIYEVP